MRRFVWAGIVIVLITFSAIAFESWPTMPGSRSTSTTASSFTTSTTANPPLVGTFLYLWYGYNSTSHRWTGGLGTSHWNDTSSGLVKDKPSLGYYASLDNETLGAQLSEMKNAGISVIIVSWWGTGNTTQSGDSATLDGAINNATSNLFRYLEATKSQWQFKVAMMVEPFNQTYNMTPHDYVRLYDYLYVHYYRPFDDLMLNWQGKPLLASFNADWSGYGGGFQAGRLPSNSTFTYRLVGGRPNPVDWNFWAGMNFLDASGGNAEPQNYEYDPVVSPDGEVGISPTYDDYYLWLAHQRPGYMRFDYQMSEGMYGSEWTYVLGKAGSVSLVLIYSWNEYHERTAIEPHVDASSPLPPSYLLNQTERYVSELGQVVLGGGQ